ncbi:putative membrane protein [Saonia flava]|uniref:Putative membrane protein n=1 Tax=Saonia flava TaxID=523696 RepID=A0A846QQT5_9FLAO|nr:DUF2306 domain-containing protein [Saonia flava]NJB70501.1 putative membrane protein [Saonia flava]
MNFKKAKTSIGYFFMSVFAIFIGLYPIAFMFIPEDQSLLSSKPEYLLQENWYLIAFYTHIFLGGLSLLVGFSQFFKKLRKKRLGLHKLLGKIYVYAVLLSGVSGLVIAFFASGGIISAFGFGALAILWLYTTAMAYLTIKQKNIDAHQRWMIKSYALCFAAVTLRVYLPIFLAGFKMEFIFAYRIIAWLCWVPNLLVAEFLIVRPLKTTHL